MKKILILALAINCFAYNSIAQDTRDKLALGLKAGLNSSNVFDAKGEEFSSSAKLGTVVGAYISLPIGQLLGVQPEIIYSPKGFGGKGVMLGYPYEFTRKTSYLDFPLLAALKPTELISIFAGPQFSYLLKQTDSFGEDVVTFEQEAMFNNDKLRQYNLGFVIGADININHFVISGRAGWDVQNNTINSTTITPRYKNVIYQATIGFRIY